MKKLSLSLLTVKPMHCVSVYNQVVEPSILALMSGKNAFSVAALMVLAMSMSLNWTDAETTNMSKTPVMRAKHCNQKPCKFIPVAAGMACWSAKNCIVTFHNTTLESGCSLDPIMEHHGHQTGVIGRSRPRTNVHRSNADKLTVNDMNSELN